MRQIPRRYHIAAAALVAGVAGVVLYAFSPEAYGFYPRCPLYVLTGLQCAGCGTLRAAHSLLHGDIAQAIAFNPVLVVAAPLMALLLFKPALAYKGYVGWAALIVVIGYSVWRNL